MLKHFFSSDNPPEVQKRQYMLAAVVFLIVLGLLVFLMTLFEREEAPLALKTPAAAKEIESGGSRIKPEEMWRFRMEEENKKLQESLQSLKDSLSQKQQDTQKDATVQKLEATLEDLQEQMRQKMSSATDTMSTTLPNPEVPTSGIQKFTLQQWGTGVPLIKTILNTIPAGAFTRSVLLSGLDASAAMSASADPRPLLLRLTDHGTLPRRFKSDLKDCHMTASAYGDLSSERVYARLEKLTCTIRKTGEIIETQVAGYIAGPDGKAGIRGKVVSKDAAFLERSLIGGLFSGLSNIANPQNRQSMVNPFSSGNPKTDAPSTKDMFSSGMAQGATNALDRLSQYYISRAEQLQPVIQVAAGQVVDVVFTEGTAFGSQGVKEKIAQSRAVNPSSPSSGYKSSETESSSLQKLPLGE